ncbi:MAG TPA: hypothetical protein VNW71_02725 [Thermoanaerobaculia bacterium]|nr:hypothetical protein [Thermoanaerobaculia bacterium]
MPAPKDQKDAKDVKDLKDEIPGVGRVVVDWQRWQDPPTRIAIGIGGVAAGPAEGRLVPYLFLGPERAEDAHLFARAYAPFRARLGRSELVFHGRGRVRPGPVEERMIVEWARRVAAEQAGGRSGGAYGLAFSWHRGGSVGSCESVSVFLTGEVWAQACAWGGDEVRGRLQPAAVGRVYNWFDSLAPFQSSRQSGTSGDAEPSRLVFAGRGTGKPGEDDRKVIEGFAAALFRELSAKRRGGAPLSAEEASSPRLLLPSQALRTSPPLARLAPKVPPPLPLDRSRPEPARTSASSGSRRPAAPPP